MPVLSCPGQIKGTIQSEVIANLEDWPKAPFLNHVVLKLKYREEGTNLKVCRFV